MLNEDRNARLDLYDALDLDGLLTLEAESPRDVDLLVSIGQHYFKLRQLDQCHAYYSKALAIDPTDGWTHLYMGNLCYGLSCYDEAASHFQRAIELLPGVACPHWCLADVYDKQGYWSRTEQQYRRAVETDPSDSKAKQKLESWLAERQSVVQNIAETSPQSDRTKP
jgi:tetratricopeptide (TPR) repeat protein